MYYKPIEPSIYVCHMLTLSFTDFSTCRKFTDAKPISNSFCASAAKILLCMFFALESKHIIAFMVRMRVCDCTKNMVVLFCSFEFMYPQVCRLIYQIDLCIQSPPLSPALFLSFDQNQFGKNPIKTAFGVTSPICVVVAICCDRTTVDIEYATKSNGKSYRISFEFRIRIKYHRRP